MLAGDAMLITSTLTPLPSPSYVHPLPHPLNPSLPSQRKNYPPPPFPNSSDLDPISPVKPACMFWPHVPSRLHRTASVHHAVPPHPSDKSPSSPLIDGRPSLPRCWRPTYMKRSLFARIIAPAGPHGPAPSPRCDRDRAQCAAPWVCSAKGAPCDQLARLAFICSASSLFPSPLSPPFFFFSFFCFDPLLCRPPSQPLPSMHPPACPSRTLHLPFHPPSCSPSRSSRLHPAFHGCGSGSGSGRAGTDVPPTTWRGGRWGRDWDLKHRWRRAWRTRGWKMGGAVVYGGRWRDEGMRWREEWFEGEDGWVGEGKISP